MRYLSFVFAILFAVFAASQEKTMVRIVIDGGISPVIAEYVQNSIASATQQKATAILIELDTPGGLMESTRQIVQSILASPVPVIVYISPQGARAASAGVFITLAAHIAVMAPNTHMGAAHPVAMFGGDIEGEMAKKVENDAAAWARTLAQTHARNPDWAEKAVRESVAISNLEALKNHVADLEANDVKDLLAKIDGRKIIINGEQRELQTEDLTVVDIPMTGRQQVVKWLSDPNLLYVLMLLGILGIFIEFQFPGLILPGLFGAICLAIVFGVQILPVNWLGAVLLLAALALFVAEIYVTSFGVLGAAGIVLLVIGSYLLFDVEGSTLGVSPVIIWTLSISFALIMLAFGYFLLKAKRQGPTSGVDTMVGQEAVLLEGAAPSQPGTIFLNGSYWAAYSNEVLEPNTKVRVERVESTRVFVKRL